MMPHCRLALTAAAVAAMLAQSAGALAQVQTIDPNTAIDGDLARPQAATPSPTPSPAPATIPAPGWAPVDQAPATAPSQPAPAPTVPAQPGTPTVGGQYPPAAAGTRAGSTWREDDLIGAAEGVFGKGARGLALMIRDILKKQGEPNGYITGREGGGAVFVGLRYGSGTLHHRIEGNQPVYWTGPSLGLDLGANAANTFVLVYNLHDTEDLFHRYGAGEGQAYLLGGFHVSYLRRDNVVVIPVRMGAGLRLGVNAGYMKFSHKQNWVPF